MGTPRAEQTKEAMVELRALEAMAVQGAQGAMAVQGAQGAMAVQGAQEAMADGPCGRGLGPLGPAPTAGTLSTPPKKKSLGKLGGIRSPPGLNRQDKTRQPSRARQTGQDRTAHRNRKPSWASSEAEASSGHDKESGALTRSLSNCFHIRDKEAGGWKWPPRPLQDDPPAPDESPWTRPTRYVKMFLWAQQDKHTALLAGTCGLNPWGLSQRRAGGLGVSRGRRRDLPLS